MACADLGYRGPDECRPSQLGYRGQRRLRGVQAQPEIVVAVRPEEVGRLVPVGVPAGADVHAALVLAQADRRREVHERGRVGVGHVGADGRGVVGGVRVVGGLEAEGEVAGRVGQVRARLELDVDVGLAPLMRADRAVRPRRPVVEQHHVVLDHPQPAGLGVAPGTGRVFEALPLAPVFDVGAAAVEPGLLVVPERKADRDRGLDVRRAQDARQLHHQRRARCVVIGGLAEAVAVHVRAEDVHLVGPRGADPGAVDLRALAVGRFLQVERAQRLVRLGQGIADDAGGPPVAEDRAAARTAAVASDASARRRWAPSGSVRYHLRRAAQRRRRSAAARGSKV